MSEPTISFNDNTIVRSNIKINTGPYTEHNYYAALPARLTEAEVAAAQALLATLPESSVPEPAALLVPHRMPLSANPLFVGRAADLRALATTLKAGTTTVIAATTGIGGLGKTQLASEFVHRYGQFFAGGVFWMSFADGARVAAEIASCGAALDLPSYADLKQDEQVQRVLAIWAGPLPRLLVFDNCEDEVLLHTYAPTSGSSRVLVTSRRHEWDASLGVRTHALEVLPRAESIALLRRFRPDLSEDDSDLDAIAYEVGDLPLALHLAGSFLKRYRRDTMPAEYVSELRAAAVLAHESMEGTDLRVSPTRHELNVKATFNLSYQRLDVRNPTDALALALLARAAHFAPGDPIPRELLLQTVELPDAAAERRASRAVSRLVNLGLVDEEINGAVRLHRLVARFVFQAANDDEAQTAVEMVMIDTSYDRNKQGYPALMALLRGHLHYVTEMAMNRNDEQAATLCANVAYYLYQITDYTAARPFYERAYAIFKHVLGAEHPETIRSLGNLAMLRFEQGDYAVARPLIERVLTFQQSLLEEDDPETARSLNNLAQILLAQGDAPAARLLHERALTVRERVFGADHPDTAQSLNNLAGVLQAQGDYIAARSRYERAIRIQEHELGADHPHTLSSLSNFAQLLQAQGDYIAARHISEHVLAIRENIFHADHTDIANSMNNLGEVLYTLGDYIAARSHYERALSICERVLGPNHPHTQIVRRNLALLTRSQNTHDK